ncbi:MAG: hypothetical protein JW774_10875 [Candidatus Aureabacteria bacterium]|nr:hypothetical protein [Candidatus Auribacterota bacterium]
MVVKNKDDSVLISMVLLSTALHFLFISPFSASWITPFWKSPYLKQPDIPIEFELFQASPREEKKIFIPSYISSPESSPVPEPISPADGDIPVPTLENTRSLMENIMTHPEAAPENEPEASLEEQEAIPRTEKKTSDVLQTEMELTGEAKEMAWDYSNRTRSLIENHLQFPDNLKSKGIQDSVKVLITINRQGKLVKNTPFIPPEYASRFQEFNQASITAVLKASTSFTPIPSRYPKEEITFLLPIRYAGDKPQTIAQNNHDQTSPPPEKQ